ncbi:MAG: type II toxin-antitoxin system Phd/YefM family antitoxin [Pseudomonadota bacterium]
MATVNVHEAKTQFSKLLAEVEAGGEVVIARAGKPVARLVPLEQPKPRRQAGTLKGKIKWDERFWDPLPEEDLRLWEGHGD